MKAQPRESVHCLRRSDGSLFAYPHLCSSSTDLVQRPRVAYEAARLAGMNLLKRIARRLRLAADAGMTTAEYAVGTVAAVGFAVVLYKVVRSPAVSAALSSMVQSALHAI
jgi:hypothetical protein